MSEEFKILKKAALEQLAAASVNLGKAWDLIDPTAQIARTTFVDLGWTPPRKPIDVPQIPVAAYMHATADSCVNTDPTAYENSRELVLKNDVVDHIEWLEHGINEWRAQAFTMAKLLKKSEDARDAELRAYDITVSNLRNQIGAT